jgi:hypothetical protein
MMPKATAAMTILLLLACSDARHERYSSYAELASAGAGPRSWFPECTPKSAYDLENRHDLDSNQVAGHFRLPKRDIAAFGCGQLVSVSETQLNPQLEGWPHCLRGNVTNETVRSCGMKGYADGNFSVVVDPRSSSVFYWSR